SLFVQKSGYVGSLRRVSRRRHALGKGELFVIPPIPVTPQDGRFHGRLGPSLFGNGGHMYLTFCKPTQTDEAVAAARIFSVTPPPPPLQPPVPMTRAATTGTAMPLPPPPVPMAARAATNGADRIRYGDTCQIVAKKIRPRGEGAERAPVVRAAVTHSLRRHQAGVGGFLRSDGKGKPFKFVVHHAPPHVTAVAVYAVGADGRIMETHTHHKV
ncbi:unnamed protein product, partial [Phaeothamnion confervicola]